MNLLLLPLLFLGLSDLPPMPKSPVKRTVLRSPRDSSVTVARPAAPVAPELLEALAFATIFESAPGVPPITVLPNDVFTPDLAMINYGDGINLIVQRPGPWSLLISNDLVNWQVAIPNTEIYGHGVALQANGIFARIVPVQ